MKEEKESEEEALNLSEVELMLQNERPEVTLSIRGIKITFLCDSGACRTVMHPNEIPHVKPSDDYIFVKAARGKVHKENLSEPVTISDPCASSFCLEYAHAIY